jgi:hypothetical protein
VVRLLTQMRLQGELPFGWIADNTRWMRKPDTFSSAEHALRVTAQAYRRQLWNDQDAYVEIWLEKDALAGVLYQVTAEWDVPLMVTRGYASISYLHAAAQTIVAEAKPTYLYYFGDYDPSGMDISRTVERRLREFAPDEEICFTRLAVTEEQIEQWNLPTRPTKKSDSRSKGFLGESVEVDAIPANQLRRLAEECITEHIDFRALEKLRLVEEKEKEILLQVAKNLSESTR